MGVKITCDGETHDDCQKCDRMSSSHSLHYDRYYKQKVSEITCGIGGCRVFGEDGNRLDRD